MWYFSTSRFSRIIRRPNTRNKSQGCAGRLDSPKKPFFISGPPRDVTLRSKVNANVLQYARERAASFGKVVGRARDRRGPRAAVSPEWSPNGWLCDATASPYLYSVVSEQTRYRYFVIGISIGLKQIYVNNSFNYLITVAALFAAKRSLCYRPFYETSPLHIKKYVNFTPF